ncbi:hypothetical protein SLEP1_g25184 [Rubroshorea leprosula]|uniref:Uncharacterized protein n=1 Tax=Rubroshorea leprosula TaxID=152421 RepID=A0AAV5JIB5_9ROSI|nr:hypothetical protein SLEP1_g25184 [Rubroshorea leprosula]
MALGEERIADKGYKMKSGAFFAAFFYMFLFHGIVVVTGVENWASFVFIKGFRIDDNYCQNGGEESQCNKDHS